MALFCALSCVYVMTGLPFRGSRKKRKLEKGAEIFVLCKKGNEVMNVGKKKGNSVKV